MTDQEFRAIPFEVLAGQRPAQLLRFADPPLYEVISRRDQAHTVAEKSYL